MPYSALFQGYIFRTTTMSLKPSTTSTTHLFSSLSRDPRPPPPRNFGKAVDAAGMLHEEQPVPPHACLAPPLNWNACIVSGGGAGLEAEEAAEAVRSSAVPFYQQNLSYGRFAYQDASASEESDAELGSSQRQMGGSTLDNIDEWRWKLTMLLRNKDEQELVSRERKDRRDFDHLSALASRMGLHSRQYSRVVVFSKVPQPNYRPDLDDKRPQREVVLPFGLHREVDAHLKAYLSQKPMSQGNVSDLSLSRSNSSRSITNDGGHYEQQEPLIQNTDAMEKILQRKSLQLRNRQRHWQIYRLLKTFILTCQALYRNLPEGQKMLELRKSLPAYKKKDALLKAVSENQVLVVSGETGCGKTTHFLQFICTQPRRISAMAVSERVAAERGENLGESVGYKVRLEGMKGRDTRLLFCTTGILLRRLLVDRKLRGVTHVIVDEIHERGMNEDFLLIVLKELLPRRPELRLILMSATLNAELFSSYFGVRAHFLENILEMTGYQLNQYNQIDDYGHEKSGKCRNKLKVSKRGRAKLLLDVLEAADFREYSPRTQESLSCWNPDSIGFNLIGNLLLHIVRKERPGAILDQLQAHPLLGDPSRVLLLACHGSMPSSEQKLIFDKPEDGVRKIVLATNMAETSITINDVVFVVDCGKAKETSYDALITLPVCFHPGFQRLLLGKQSWSCSTWECYHLYPRCVYNAFADYQLPELLRTPLQSLCLQIKSLQLGSISEFLSRPCSHLNLLFEDHWALDDNEDLTVLVRKINDFMLCRTSLVSASVEPKLGKMLILGSIFNCLDPVMTVVAGLSMRDPFLMPHDKKDLAESAKAQFSAHENSDHLALIRAYDGWRSAERTQSGYEYCWRNFLSVQTLKAIDSLRKQFFFLLKDAGLVDHNTENCNTWSHDEHLVRAVICAGLFPGICSVVNKEKSIMLKTQEDGQVMLYSSSVNGNIPKIPYPWLVFNEKVKVNSVFLRDSTGISDSVLLLFGGNISRGGLDGHLKMLGGYLEFFMNPALAETYLCLKRELDELIHNKLLNPKLDMQSHTNLLSA
ncbi:ATP-dependent RNA helicase DHX36-like [Pyrus ussuriensis x Pyrus communis]|uniref:RNA helicase n=1 Tax=Pyrus ussuriensis x Pyrus communis TaxID=2448454 RepID=A0A5N5G6Y5_9ROSA|nr:ATP-dependent RNA helicase DHX36-like [Pyrus ussuriensis x Pyrus communis]